MVHSLTSHTLGSVLKRSIIHPSICRCVFSEPTHCEYVSVFTLHPGQELGSIFAKFECVSQPWDQSFVQRRLLLGPEEENAHTQMK